MRFLITAHAALGHLRPLIGIAQALETAGHETLTATDDVARDDLAAAGLPFRALPHIEGFAGIAEDGIAQATTVLAPSERAAFSLRYFVDRAVTWTPAIVELVEEFEPDVIVRETSFWASWLAGEITHVPVAMFCFTPVVSGSTLDSVSGNLFSDALSQFGLPADPGLTSITRWLSLLGFPPSWIGSDRALEATTHLVQPPEPREVDDGRATALLAGLPDRPTVYVTLGTTFNQTPGAFAMVLAGMHELEVNVVATTGRSLDPASLGPQPAHVRLTRFIPQQLLLPHCDAVVAHGGYGSLMGALQHGLPVVSLPLAAADNITKANRLSELGAGIAVHEEARSSRAITDAVSAVLHDGSYRAAARALAAEIAALPSPAATVRLLEQLGETRAPVVRSGSARY